MLFNYDLLELFSNLALIRRFIAGLRCNERNFIAIARTV